MKVWLPILIAVCVPGGCLIALAMEIARRRRDAEPNLVPRWKAFIESDPIIVPAAVPPLRPLKAQRVDRIARFKHRLAR